jgi:hypothetical protein
MKNYNIELEWLNSYLDIYKLPVKKTGDGGDCAHDVGFLHSCLAYMDSAMPDMYNESLKMLAGSEPGKYVRHPDPNMWYSNERTFSRDQSVNLQCSMLANGRTDLVKQIFQTRLKYKKLAHFNDLENDGVTEKVSDIPSPEEIAIWIRAFGLWFLYPLLTLLDLSLVLGVTIFRTANQRSLWDSDAHLIPRLIATETKYPTLSSKIAIYLYSTKQNSVERQLQNYYNNKNPGHNLAPLAFFGMDAYKKLCGKS